MIPDLRHIVEQCKAQNQAAWRNAHTGNAHTEDFIRLLAPMLKAVDPRFALNGKRGNPNDISDDAVNVLCDAEDSDGRTPDGRPCAVIDVISSAGAQPPYTPQNPAPAVAWSVFRTLVEGSGANVDPGATPQPPQPPMPTQPPGREEALDELKWLDGYYKAPEGLQRPQGLSLNGAPDFEGVAAWYLDVYQRDRMAMKSRADSRANYVSQIRHSEEWRLKHPGETP